MWTQYLLMWTWMKVVDENLGTKMGGIGFLNLNLEVYAFRPRKLCLRFNFSFTLHIHLMY
jgi:hypothetical protein